MQHSAVPVVFGSYESVYDIVDSTINSVLKPFNIEEYAKKWNN
jgi:3-polyprenyl-4-hydroxybenzoate decarboxylase